MLKMCAHVFMVNFHKDTSERKKRKAGEGTTVYSCKWRKWELFFFCFMDVYCNYKRIKSVILGVM